MKRSLAIQKLNNFVLGYNDWFVEKGCWQPQLELCCGNKNCRQSPKSAGNRWQPAAILNPDIVIFSMQQNQTISTKVYALYFRDFLS